MTSFLIYKDLNLCETFLTLCLLNINAIYLFENLYYSSNIAFASLAIQFPLSGLVGDLHPLADTHAEHKKTVP